MTAAAVLTAAARTASSGRAVRGAVGIAGLLGLAELAGRAGLYDSSLIPLPSTVLSRAGTLVVNGTFLADLGATLTAWAEALLITIAAAVPVGLALGTLPWMEAAVRPLVEFLRPIPSVALVPLVLLLTRSDVRMEVAVIIYAAVWPVLINTLYGVREVDPLAKDTLRSYGFGPLDVLRRVTLPSAAPFIMTGIRLAASTALIVAVAVELNGGRTNGIGVFLIQAESGGGDISVMIASILCVGVLGLIINALLVATERRLFRWHHALTAEAQ
ncbi:MAG TPA: ABC transporter permease [Streptosporangiaceae bacterium]|nr:ABC transporter permease [Streptosporangiaceae bacterium]